MPDPSYKEADGGVKLRNKAWADVIAWRLSGPLGPTLTPTSDEMTTAAGAANPENQPTYVGSACLLGTFNRASAGN